MRPSAHLKEVRDSSARVRRRRPAPRRSSRSRQRPRAAGERVRTDHHLQGLGCTLRADRPHDPRRLQPRVIVSDLSPVAWRGVPTSSRPAMGLVGGCDGGLSPRRTSTACCASAPGLSACRLPGMPDGARHGAPRRQARPYDTLLLPGGVRVLRATPSQARCATLARFALLAQPPQALARPSADRQRLQVDGSPGTTPRGRQAHLGPRAAQGNPTGVRRRCQARPNRTGALTAERAKAAARRPEMSKPILSSRLAPTHARRAAPTGRQECRRSDWSAQQLVARRAQPVEHGRQGPLEAVRVGGPTMSNPPLIGTSVIDTAVSGLIRTFWSVSPTTRRRSTVGLKSDHSRSPSG